MAGDGQTYRDEEQDDAQSEEECIHFLEAHAPRHEGVMGWMDSRNQGIKGV